MFERERMESVLGKIRETGGKRVFLQVPEGLKTGVQELVDFLEVSGLEVFLSVEPFFGSFDLRINEAGRLECDLILHVGHSDFGVKSGIPVIYENYEIEIDPIPLLEFHLKKLEGYKKIGLVTTIQFISVLKKVKEFLEKAGFEVKTGKSQKGVEGQILGCDHSAGLSVESGVDCFLFVGSGRFHPLGLQERTDRPVFFLDVEKNNLTNFSREKSRLEILRGMRIEKARGLERFAIIISTKPGQMKIRQAEEIKNKLKKIGKKVYVLVADQLTPEKLMGLKIDVIVNTACPRIRDDQEAFRKIILNPEDVDGLADDGNAKG